MSTRDDYVRKMHVLLDKWNAEIDDLENRAELAEANLRDSYREQIAHLRARQHDARTKLAGVRDASESAWEDLKTGLELARDAVGEAIESAKTRFKR